MFKLGLTNFRKFKELDPLEIGGVTFLVGENNSGKSSFTKAAILLSRFLSSGDGFFDSISDSEYPDKKEFSFKDSGFRHVYIDTFYQALCNRSDNGVISFETEINSFVIKINVVEPKAFIKERKETKEIVGTEDFSECYPEIRETNPVYYKEELSKETASVSSTTVRDNERGVEFIIDYENNHITIKVLDMEVVRECASVEQRFFTGDFEDGLEMEMLDLIKSLHAQSIRKRIDSQFVLSNDSVRILDTFFKQYSGDPDIELIRNSYDNFSNVINDTAIEYIYAHSVHQLSSYSYGTTGDNDYVDQTISRFYNQQIKFNRGLLKSTKSPYDIVLGWMNELDLGDGFSIKGAPSLKDNDKRLYVSIADGDNEYDLSTKGIGMIQLFTLLLRLATIVTDNKTNKTIVVEEPEQNLHPALQSKLADLFYEVYQEYGCQLIVETHSEYIVRKSQVIVSSLTKTNNPFKVYYFPSDSMPYELHYQPGGNFKEQFGPGFYDEAVFLHLKIMNNN